MDRLPLIEMDELTPHTPESTNNFAKSTDESSCRQWFVMRDLTRYNTKRPAYLMLQEKRIRYFTPMVWKLFDLKGRRERKKVPYMQDLIFVHDTRETLDRIVERIPTFQYRYLRKTNRIPMTVRDTDMERFIRAVESVESPHYYRPDEITPEMCNRRIRIIGGQLDGYEGGLITTRGSKTKRLLVELPTLLAASVEVEPEYIQLI